MTIHVLHSFLIWVICNAILLALLLFRRAFVFRGQKRRKAVFDQRFPDTTWNFQPKFWPDGSVFYLCITMLLFNCAYAGVNFLVFILGLFKLHFAL